MTESAATNGDHLDRARPETLRLTGLSASLTASDLDASLAWYRDVVGFHQKETYEEDGKVMGVELVAGSVTLFVSQDDWAKGRNRDKGQGIRLFLRTSQDVDDVAAAIESRGGTLATQPADMWGTRSFSLVDPDGFKLTISS